MNLSLCSYNVRGLGNKLKREQIFAWLKSSNHTFCMLQETHSGENTHNSWKYEWGNDAFWSGINNNSAGIGILINPTRTSDSLNEGLPIKMAREKVQRKCYFFYEKDNRFNPRLIHKISFLIGQVAIEKYGLKTLFLLFNI